MLFIKFQLQMMIFFFTLFAGSNATLQVLHLKPDMGLAKVKAGAAFIQRSSFKLSHVVDLYRLELEIDNIEATFNSQKVFAKSENVKIKLQKLKDAFKQIKIQGRFKRAWNWLGSGIKWAAGNPDAYDLESIQFRLKELTDNSNKQKINNNIFEDKINKNFDMLQNTVQPQLNKIFNEIKLIEITNQIDEIVTRINEIKSAITLAKNEIVSKNILSTEELIVIYDKLVKQGIRVDSYYEATTYTDCFAYYYDNYLIFDIQVPIVEKDFERFYVRPLPKNMTRIQIDFHEVLKKQNQTYAVTGNCLKQNSYICKIKALQEISNDICTSRILEDKPAKCIYESVVSMTYNDVIDSGIIISHSEKPVQVFNTCGIGNHTVIGSSLLIFENCSIQISNHQYENYNVVQMAKIELSHSMNFVEQITIKPVLQLHSLHELHLQNLKHLEDITVERHNHLFSYFVGGGITVLIVIIIFYVCVVKKISNIVSTKAKDIEMADVAKVMPLVI